MMRVWLGPLASANATPQTRGTTNFWRSSSLADTLGEATEDDSLRANRRTMVREASWGTEASPVATAVQPVALRAAACRSSLFLAEATVMCCLLFSHHRRSQVADDILSELWGDAFPPVKLIPVTLRGRLSGGYPQPHAPRRPAG